MWPPRSDALMVGISRDLVEWRFGKGETHRIATASQGDRFQCVSEALQQAALSARMAEVHLAVGSNLARHWIQTAPPGLRSFAELQALVQSRAEQVFGTDPGWVVAADWHASRPFLCAAVPREVELWASALVQANRATLRLSTSLALALAAHAEELPNQGWVVIHEPQALHMIHVDAGVPTTLRTVIVPPGLDDSALEAETAIELARSSAMAGGIPAQPVQVLSVCGSRTATQASAALALVQASVRSFSP